MKKSVGITILVIIALVLVGWIIYKATSGTQTASAPTGATSTAVSTGTSVTSSSPTFDQSISDGTIKISYPSTDFGLATDQTQILTHSVIPPCDPSFNYCLYYVGNAYKGTNFESAGIRIQKRTDLTTQTNCLNTVPSGFTGLKPTTATSSNYAVSNFGQVGGGAAGSIANDMLYRLFTNGACYEFETRVAQSQFANYPSGTIQEFTSADQTAVQAEIQQILSTLTLPSGETVSFPQA